MITFYKAHKGDYYCRELPYRIFKGRRTWRIQRLTAIPTTDDIEFYADSFKEAKDWLEQKATDQQTLENSFNPVCGHKNLRYTIPYTICRDCGEKWEGRYARKRK